MTTGTPVDLANRELPEPALSRDGTTERRDDVRGVPHEATDPAPKRDRAPLGREGVDQADVLPVRDVRVLVGGALIGVRGAAVLVARRDRAHVGLPGDERC